MVEFSFIFRLRREGKILVLFGVRMKSRIFVIVMKGHRKAWILAAGLVVAMLFGALWRVSAPTRQKRQLEAQATEQLQGKTTSSGSTFRRIHIRTLRYEAEYNWYDVRYALEWSSADGKSSYFTDSSCGLTRSGRGKEFSGQCWMPSDMVSQGKRTFTLSISRDS